MSNFAFLADEFPAVHEAAVEAERQAGVSPTASAFFAGKTVEVAVKWAFRSDPNLRLPYQDNISALLHEPSFRRAAGEAVFTKAKYINRLRNRAVHEERSITATDATGAVKELFHVCYWLARTYGRTSKPAPGLAFDPSQLSRRDAILKKALDHLKQQQAELDARNGELTKLLADKQSLDDELKQLRAEVAAARKAAEATPDQHDYNEAETRDRFIDLLLREAGWPLDKPEDVEFPVDGMPNKEGKGFVDYVLWGANGRPVALVEAKRTRKDAREGQQQAKLYADRLEAQFRQRPVIFYSNGYEHWIWDDTRYPPRQVGGFYKRDELELLIQRRTSRGKLADTKINTAIAGYKRPYQQRAIRAVAKHFENDGERKALLVMATGSGKTRTVIALIAPPDARRLGQARALSGGSRCAREPGGGRIQGAPSGFGAGQPRHRAHQRWPRIPLDLSDDDEPDRWAAGRQDGLRSRSLRSHRHRRGPPLGLSALSCHLRLFRQFSRRTDGDTER